MSHDDRPGATRPPASSEASSGPDAASPSPGYQTSSSPPSGPSRSGSSRADVGDGGLPPLEAHEADVLPVETAVVQYPTVADLDDGIGDDGRKDDPEVKEKCCTYTRFGWIRNWVCFTLLGLINNVEYCVVTSAAKTLSEQFGMEDHFGYILFANIAMGILSQIVNAFLCQGVPHSLRMNIMCGFYVTGLCGIAFVSDIFSWEHYPRAGFWLVVFFVTFISGSTQFGESLILGYMRCFDRANVVGGWGTGTGLAGICGSGFYLLFRSVGLKMVWRFLFFVPWIWAYLIVFGFGVKEPTEEERKKMEEKRRRKMVADEKKREEKRRLKELKKGRSVDGMAEEKDVDVEVEVDDLRRRGDSDDPDDEAEPLLRDPEEEEEEEEEGPEGDVDLDFEIPPPSTPPSTKLESEDEKPVKCAFCRRLFHCLRYCWWASLNLFLVYWFEYVISTGLAEKLFVQDPRHPRPNVSWALRNNYEILQFCYQFGVTISRSSVRVVRIPWVWIMTLLQLLFVGLWFSFAFWGYMSTNVCLDILPFQLIFFSLLQQTLIWVTFPIMIIVGLMGGASYVNCYYLILNNTKLVEKDREFSANLTAITNTIGITAASVTTIILDQTIFKGKTT